MGELLAHLVCQIFWHCFGFFMIDCPRHRRWRILTGKLGLCAHISTHWRPWLALWTVNLSGLNHCNTYDLKLCDPEPDGEFNFHRVIRVWWHCRPARMLPITHNQTWLILNRELDQERSSLKWICSLSQSVLREAYRIFCKAQECNMQQVAASM